MARRPDITNARETRARAAATARARATAAAAARAAAAAATVGAVGATPGAVANPTTPPVVAQPDDALPAPPEVDFVQPGDLITAQYMNDVIAAIQDLQLRVELLETPDNSAQPGGGVA